MAQTRRSGSSRTVKSDGAQGSLRRLERLADAYRLPSINEVAQTVTCCSDSTVGRMGAVVIALAGPISDRKVFLTSRIRPPFARTKALSGGLVEVGESPQEAAVRYLAEQVGISGGLTHTGMYTGSARDPRLIDASAFVVVMESPTEVATTGDGSARGEWLSIDHIAEGRVSLGFDHAQMLRDALALVDNGSPYLGRLEEVVQASTNRNVDLLAEVDRMRGRGVAHDQQVRLHEFDAYRRESASRLRHRDGFVHMTVALVVALLCLLAVKPSFFTFAVLAVPWVTLCLGWLYLASTERIMALQDYSEHSMSYLLGARRLPWEGSLHGTPGLRAVHSLAQTTAAEVLFVVPGLVAPIVVLTLGFPSPSVVVVAIVEIVFAVALGALFVVQAVLFTKRKAVGL